ITNLLPFGTYTITHPYGVDALVANNLGQINVTFNSGVAGFFGPATVGSRVGDTFLRWDASLPAPPAGFFADRVAQHPLPPTFSRARAPPPPAAGGTQPLSVGVGKILDICGNGAADPGERCADGNKPAGACCSPTSKFEPLGSPCTAATVCTNNACNGAGAC